jgi:desulfoferrodoxin (superoxide reductase-like protein)
MVFRQCCLLFCLCVMTILTLNTHALANKTAVSIQAPAEVPKGSEVLIQVIATHSADNPLHYTEWLYVVVNGKEIARWNYTAFHRPGSETFTKEIKYIAAGNLEIKAEGSCNLHGSAGPATLKISVKD